MREMKNTFSKKENLIFLRELFYCREISRIRMWWNEVRSKSKHPPRKPEPCASDLSHVDSNSEDPRVSPWGEGREVISQARERLGCLGSGLILAYLFISFKVPHTLLGAMIQRSPQFPGT